MIADVVSLFVLAQEGSGRGDNPSDVGGILIIVGIVILVIAVVALAGWLLATRGGRTRRDVSRRRPHRRGRVGRT